MKLLRRNTTEFDYRPYKGKTEILIDGKHTGRYEVTYGEPIPYRGNIDLPNGYVAKQLFGIDTDYTNIVLMDDRNADIREEGHIIWEGHTYLIQSIRRSLNVLALAIKQLPSPETPPLGTGDDG